MDKAAMEQKRLEMRLRSERLDRERKFLLKLAVHNSARQKAEKYGFQWEDVHFYEDEVYYDKAKKEQVGGAQVQMEYEDISDGEGEGEAEEEDSADDWADISSSDASASSEEREASTSTSYESAQEEPAAGEGASSGADVSDEEMAELPASPPRKRQSLDGWTDRSYLAGGEASGGDEPDQGPACERRCGAHRDF